MRILQFLKNLFYGFCSVALARVLNNVVAIALVGSPPAGLDGDVDIFIIMDERTDWRVWTFK